MKRIFIFCLVVAVLSIGTNGFAAYKVGTLLKAEHNSALYLVVPTGKIAHIPHPRIIECIGFQNTPAVSISQQELNSMPQTPLLFQSQSGAIYLIDSDKKRHISSPEVMRRRGYDSATIQLMPDVKLDCIRDGRAI